jgi:hypothetical protein
MQSNSFDIAILGTIHHGQAIVVDGMHRESLRELVSKFTRCLSLRLRDWRSLMRTPAGLAPAMATCPSYSGSRSQRNGRWMPGVVVGPGTVGVV